MEALSYRQAGKASTGVLMRGKIAGQGSSGKNFSSIPSKFETTLFTGNKEREGFGSRAHRFVDLENDLPGPGAYEGNHKLLDERVYSKKGLGVGFVSKTKRASAFGAASAAPGPGSYEPGSSLTRANISGSTSRFKAPTVKSVVVASDPTPGPGNYDVLREQYGTQRMHSSVFRSGTQRGMEHLAGQRNLPAPGQYNPHTSSLFDEDLPSAAFRSGVPIVGQGPPARLTREQQLGIVAAQTPALPGPGDYEPPLVGSSSIRRRMPQFCESNLDRFGNALGGTARKFQTPGPGSYLYDEPRQGAVISGAVFMSGTNRNSSTHDVVPGPAYYSPAPNGKKSHHLNARSRWVPG